MPTIIDVAKAANVSKSTVSLVINGSPAVKPETRENVLAAIRELGYTPNVNARSLISKKTNNLGVIMLVEKSGHRSFGFDMDTDLFHFDIVAGIPALLEGTDYGLLMEEYCLEESGGELPNLVKSNRVDGIFLIGSLVQKQFIDRIRETKIPCVLIGCETSRVDSVMPDVEQATVLSARHLLATGHKQIYLLNCPPVFMTNISRVNGLKKALEEAEADVRHRIVNAGSNSGAGGYALMKKLWEQGERPDGIIAANDNIALGARRYLYEAGIRIPDQVSLISYEDSVLSAYAAPALTTTDIHKERIGEKACEILLRRIHSPKMRKTSLVLPTDLVIRDSVKDRRK